MINFVISNEDESSGGEDEHENDDIMGEDEV